MANGVLDQQFTVLLSLVTIARITFLLYLSCSDGPLFY